jgi:hypothetical protein
MKAAEHAERSDEVRHRIRQLVSSEDSGGLLTAYVGDEPESWVASLAAKNDLPLLRSPHLSDEIIADVARVALAKVGTSGPPSAATTWPLRYTANCTWSASPVQKTGSPWSPGP